MKAGIPEFNKLIEPLHRLMEDVYARAGKRTKTCVARVALHDAGWNESHKNAFQKCKEALSSQVKLSHRDYSKRLCVYTDASDSVWSGVVTQVPIEDKDIAHIQKRHEPLAFLSGRFSGAQSRWSILEKEAFAIMSTLDKIHWVLAGAQGFDLFTDHSNLVFIFDPLAVCPDISQSSLKKVLRWAIRLSMYNYVCIHILGTENVWADLLGRWSAPQTNIVQRIVCIPPLPTASAEEFEWPTDESLLEAQERHSDKRPVGLSKSNGLWTSPNGSIWIPDQADDIQLRICIIAHTSAAGHRGAGATEAAIRRNFFWGSLTEDVRMFLKA